MAKAGKKGSGYMIFTASASFIAEQTSLNDVANFLGDSAKRKSIGSAVYNGYAVNGVVILRKDEVKELSLRELMRICREYDKRYVAANKKYTEAKYFNHKYEAKAYAKEQGWEEPNIFKAAMVEKYLPEELYLSIDPNMPLQLVEN